MIGASSGIGRATAARLARRGWRVALTARRPVELERSAVDACAGMDADTVLSLPGDVTQLKEAETLAKAAHSWLGRLDAVIHCAGTNVKARSWRDVSAQDFERVAAVNYLSAAYSTIGALPYLRERGGGALVLTSSWGGWRYLGRVGAAYGSSKTALSAMVESLNHEEGAHGVRATLLVPGEVATELIRRHPDPPTDDDLAAMLQPHDVADIVEFLVTRPAGVCVNELVVSPTVNRLYQETP